MFSIIADILAVIGFALSVFIAFRIFPNNENTGFDYQAILVGIVCGIFTLLVGWNIYQAIDLSKAFSKVEDLKSNLERELNYIHNKTDYNQGLMYAIISQTASANFAPNEVAVVKYQMIIKAITAMKIFSKFPDCQKEIDSLIKTTMKGLTNSKTITFPDKDVVDFLMLCGEIENRESINNFTEFINLLENCRERQGDK